MLHSSAYYLRSMKRSGKLALLSFAADVEMIRLYPRIHEQKNSKVTNEIRYVTNGNFNSCNSCKRLGTSRLHELHESKFPFVSRIEFIRSKLSNFSAHVYGVCECRFAARCRTPVVSRETRACRRATIVALSPLRSGRFCLKRGALSLAIGAAIVAACSASVLCHLQDFSCRMRGIVSQLAVARLSEQVIRRPRR